MAVPLDPTAALTLARRSIERALGGQPLDGEPHEGALALPGACFVSLHLGGELRGCIGQTDPVRPLGEHIAANACAAAFRDPRFGPLTRAELERVTIEVHVLAPLEPIAFTDLADLHRQLRPGIDGLQLESGGRRALFLPVMWEQLPAPEEFVAQLLRKAGIRDTAGLLACRFSATVLR